MEKCSKCMKEIDGLYFKCHYCNLIHCDIHRLPEEHDCKYEFKSIFKIWKGKELNQEELIKPTEVYLKMDKGIKKKQNKKVKQTLIKRFFKFLGV
jgi:hypothetical protein